MTTLGLGAQVLTPSSAVPTIRKRASSPSAREAVNRYVMVPHTLANVSFKRRFVSTPLRNYFDSRVFHGEAEREGGTGRKEMNRSSNSMADIRHIGGEEATEPPGSGCFQGAPDRVHQAAGGDNSRPRAESPQSPGSSSQCCGRVSNAAVQELPPRADSPRERCVSSTCNSPKTWPLIRAPAARY